MPINPDACPGICNRRYRDAWTAYDQALTRHEYELLLYLDSLERHHHALAAWHAPLAYPAEPTAPARPEPPATPHNTGTPVWCTPCSRLIRTALAELDDTAAVLAAGIDGHRGAAVAGPNGTKPLDHTAIVESLDELYGDLVEVEDQWRQARGYPPRPRRARGAHARAVTVGWLLGQLDDILLHPGSVEFGLSVLRWQRRLRAMAKVDPASKRSPIACPRCKEPKVSRRDDDYYECGTCGRLLNQDEHDREFARQADQHDHEQQEVGAS